jgi:hypothetical protein
VKNWLHCVGALALVAETKGHQNEYIVKKTDCAHPIKILQAKMKSDHQMLTRNKQDVAKVTALLLCTKKKPFQGG